MIYYRSGSPSAGALSTHLHSPVVDAVSRSTASVRHVCHSIAGLVALAFVAMPLAASADDPPPIQVNPVSQERGEFTDEVSIRIDMKAEGESETQVFDLDDASHLVVAEVIVQPGAVFPWHTHPATSISIIEEGDLVYVTETCVERHYPAGTANVDSGQVHTAYNPSETEEMVMLATMIGAPASGPLTHPIDPEEGAVLDEKCDIER